jgi:hypothetical protein
MCMHSLWTAFACPSLTLYERPHTALSLNGRATRT